MESTNTKTKSQQYLEQALIALLGHKRFEEITVKALVQKAGISRTSFYALYRDKQDFIERFNIGIFEELSHAIDRKSLDRFSERNFIEYHTALYTHIRKRAGVFAAMLGPNGDPSFREQMKLDIYGHWQEKFFVHLNRTGMSQSELQEVEAHLQYIVSAHVGMIEYWLDGNLHLSPRFMADRIYQLTWNTVNNESLKKFLNI